MDRVFLRRVWEDVGRAWGWCAVAHRDVRNFGHFLGRGGVLDDFRRDRGTHRRCGKRFSRGGQLYELPAWGPIDVVWLGRGVGPQWGPDP